MIVTSVVAAPIFENRPILILSFTIANFEKPMLQYNESHKSILQLEFGTLSSNSKTSVR